MRHSKEERVDLDWEEEEKARMARREAQERGRIKHDECPVEGEAQSACRRLIGWFCGISGTQATEPTEDEVAEAAKQLPDISEDPVWKHMVNANALVMMTVAVYLWGFYA